jgi:hypothetical protein
MNYKLLFNSFIFSLLIYSIFVTAQIYPDQHYVLRIDSLFANIDVSDGIKLSDDGKSIMLEDGKTNGYVELTPQTSNQPFNHGLPSWNGSALGNNSSFKVQMRFPYGSGWSPWLTVGFWKNNIWAVYGTTSYGGGFIDYDYVKLYSYQNSWQFKIIMTRTSVSEPSPTIHKLSFFVSDSRTTTNANISQIVNDNPAAVFIPTSFIYQYGVDPVIGPSICSPTSVAMILKSYNIEVDPYQFAVDTRDPYYNMFGIWPRVVQNASEYGLDGAVTRYRTWSDAQEVLVNGGRIAMSIGQPLYTGHLVMLAGFTSDGRPIVHDPAKSNGYSFIFNKTNLSEAWFKKGGVAYTFYPADGTTSIEIPEDGLLVNDFELFQNYPNPFNPGTIISWQSSISSQQTLKVFDILGNEIAVLVDEYLPAGRYSVEFNSSTLHNNLPSGIYFYQLRVGEFSSVKKMNLVK